MQRSWQIDRSDQLFSKASSTSKHVNCTSQREASAREQSFERK